MAIADVRSSRSTDAEAITASVAHPAAFEAIFERHFTTISRYLRRRLPAAVADDLAAAVFTTAFAARHAYDPTRPDALPWLYGIAANLIRRHARDEEQELRVRSRLVAPALHAVEEPPDELLRHDLDRRLAGALAELEQRDREVIFLFAWANLGYADIGRALDLPIGTVKSRLHRARRTLRAALGASATEAEVANG